jgi:hypothetical protein
MTGGLGRDDSRGNEGKGKKALVVRHCPRYIFNGLVSVAPGTVELWSRFKDCVLADMLVFWKHLTG